MSEHTVEPTIEHTVEQWHAFTRGELPGGLDELLADDVVFLSPVVFTPQRGKQITAAYLSAAFSTLAGGKPLGAGGDGNESGGGFRYVKQVVSGHTAVLEFETTMDGSYVNGVDMITCDDHGLITDFKVMVRPARAVDAVKAQMLAALELFQAGGAGPDAPG